jgi:hypothetical protein
MLVELGKQIVLLGDEVSGTTDHALAMEWLARAKVVCLLGLGFNDIILDRLQIRNLQRKRVWCTRFGLGEGRVGRAARVLNWPNVRWCSRQWDLVKFLGETGVIHGWEDPDDPEQQPMIEKALARGRLGSAAASGGFAGITMATVRGARTRACSRWSAVSR